MNYPEHEKLHGVKDESQAIGDFITIFLAEKGISLSKSHEHTDECYDEHGHGLCGYRKEELHTFPFDIQDLLAEHFGIDRNKLEDEKQAMIDEWRESHSMSAL